MALFFVGVSFRNKARSVVTSLKKLVESSSSFFPLFCSTLVARRKVVRAGKERERERKKELCLPPPPPSRFVKLVAHFATAALIPLSSAAGKQLGPQLRLQRLSACPPLPRSPGQLKREAEERRGGRGEETVLACCSSHLLIPRKPPIYRRGPGGWLLAH